MPPKIRKRRRVAPTDGAQVLQIADHPAKHQESRGAELLTLNALMPLPPASRVHLLELLVKHVALSFSEQRAMTAALAALDSLSPAARRSVLTRVSENAISKHRG